MKKLLIPMDWTKISVYRSLTVWMPHWADELHLRRAIGIIMREANLGLEVTTLDKRKEQIKLDTVLFNDIQWHFPDEQKGMAKTYFIKGVFGSFEGHVPQEQIIVIF